MFDCHWKSKQMWIRTKKKLKKTTGVRIMLFNATFNKISVTSWRSVLLVGETIVPAENHRHVVSH